MNPGPRLVAALAHLLVAGTTGCASGGSPPEDGSCVPRIEVTETFDGSFRATLALPGDFPTGESYVTVIDWDVGDCDDTASCAGPSDTFRVAE